MKPIIRSISVQIVGLILVTISCAHQPIQEPGAMKRSAEQRYYEEEAKKAIDLYAQEVSTYKLRADQSAVYSLRPHNAFLMLNELERDLYALEAAYQAMIQAPNDRWNAAHLRTQEKFQQLERGLAEAHLEVKSPIRKP